MTTDSVKRLTVEKILKGSMDLIPSPSVKIQIMGVVNKLLKTISLLTSPSNVLPYYQSQENFPANNLNCHWR
jgi:hypothetical protein